VTIKAILDTNIVISGIFWKGVPFEILKAWQEHRFCLALTLPILNEYRRVLDEMTKKHPLPVIGSILEVIELYSEMVEPVSLAGVGLQLVNTYALRPNRTGEASHRTFHATAFAGIGCRSLH
jgi:hypothetical protein